MKRILLNNALVALILFALWLVACLINIFWQSVINSWLTLLFIFGMAFIGFIYANRGLFKNISTIPRYFLISLVSVLIVPIWFYLSLWGYHILRIFGIPLPDVPERVLLLIAYSISIIIYYPHMIGQ